MDADMELTKNVIKDAIELCNNGFDAIILPEDSFGVGPWARAKNLERRFFWGDDTVESPRFFRTKVWHQLGGYDDNIAGGGDDRDLYQKTLKEGYKDARTKSLVFSINKSTISFQSSNFIPNLLVVFSARRPPYLGYLFGHFLRYSSMLIPLTTPFFPRAFSIKYSPNS